jgi:Zn finger protein HypA/HybF involved in hydrogenase expression
MRARYFMRREDYQPRETPRDSPFRRFDVKCLKCGSYDLRLVAQMDEELGEMALLLVCNKCRQREILPVSGDANNVKSVD